MPPARRWLARAARCLCRLVMPWAVLGARFRCLRAVVTLALAVWLRFPVVLLLAAAASAAARLSLLAAARLVALRSFLVVQARHRVVVT